MPTGENTSASSRLQNAFEIEQDIKSAVKNGILGYGGIIVSILFAFITIVAVSTDISISVESINELSSEFFLLFFCSYASYICCADSGKKAGKISKIYTDTINKFDEIHRMMVDNKIHCILGDFCRDYIAQELKNARSRYLVSVGIEYDEYIAKYASLDDQEIKELEGLSLTQKKALISANGVKPIKLSPEQITRHESAYIRHSPLLISPSVMMGAKCTVKFITSFIIVICLGRIVLTDIGGGSWASFALVCVKFSSVLYNCFSGYKSGYENVVVHAVNYKNEQISLMQQAIAYKAEREEYVKSEYIGSDTVGAGTGDSESELLG
jgi:hypothetical protein